MDEQYYILTTKLPQCLNLLTESGLFKHLRRKQPDTGAFLDTVASLPREQRPRVQMVFFDRVPGSDTSWRLTGVYELKDVYVDSDAGLSGEGQDLYTLALERTAVFDPPIAFRQGSTLWERLETTRETKTAKFYGGGRMLLPIPPEDFQTILGSNERQEPEDDGGREPLDEPRTSGVPALAEIQLRDYLADHLELLEDGLVPFEQDKCVEYQTGDAGRIDLLCRDRNGNVVVVELKKGRPDERVVGQLCRYLGWAMEHVSQGKPVRGFVVANVISDQLRYAVRPLADVGLVLYEMRFDLRRVE